MLSEPPSRLAAARVDSNGARTTSRRRRIERSVHSGDRAASLSDSWVIAPRMASMAALPAEGIAAGSASSSRICLATPIGRRNVAST